MNINRLLMIATFSLLSSLGWAHEEGHGEAAEPIAQAQALEVATSTVAQLIEEQKIDTAWSEVAAGTAKMERQDGIQNWVVSFIDATNKKTMTIVLSNTGVYQSFATAAL